MLPQGEKKKDTNGNYKPKGLVNDEKIVPIDFHIKLENAVYDQR